MNTAYLVFTPTETNTGLEVVVDGLGFVSDGLVDLEVLLPDGSSFNVIVQADAAGDFSTTGRAKPAAVELVSTGDNVSVDDTVTLNGEVYTFKAAPTTVAKQVKVGETAAESLQNLDLALNLGDGAGSLYGSNTVLHPTIGSQELASDSLLLVARVPGTDGNALTATTTAAELSLSGATLAGGEEASGRDLVRFKSAHAGVARVSATDGTNVSEAELKISHST